MHNYSEPHMGYEPLGDEGRDRVILNFEKVLRGRYSKCLNIKYFLN